MTGHENELDDRLDYGFTQDDLRDMMITEKVQVSNVIQ
jgi:hypothetical protein